MQREINNQDEPSGGTKKSKGKSRIGFGISISQSTSEAQSGGKKKRW